MLRFWEGCSGSGKSTILYKHIISEAINNPENTYLVIVPEQFTLQTQQDIVKLHPRKGILNVDVLSFNRLAHRVFEETGYGTDGGQIIDDMGKNLILRRVSQLKKSSLPFLGDNLTKLGYITQVKSTISEFMQYGISVENAKTLADKAREDKKGRLYAKLNDVNVLYEGFCEYIKDHYTTKEELLVRLCNVIGSSEKIKNCVVAFDGFTGFTPVQLNVIEKLLECTKGVHIALTLDTLDADCGNDDKIQEHELFYLSHHTISQVGKLADKCLVMQDAPYIIKDDFPVRYKGAGAGKLAHLEANIFRNPAKTYTGADDTTDEIHIFNALNPNEEMEFNALKIMELVRGRGYKYSDIAIITGDIETYRTAIERALNAHNIPFFTDRTQPVLMNPTIEMVRAMVKVLNDNYSYESVFRFLRSNPVGMDSEDIDVFENHCIAFGVKGRSAYNKQFSCIPQIYSRLQAEEKAEYLAKVNALRVEVASFFKALENDIKENFTAASKCSVAVYAEAFKKALSSLKMDVAMDDDSRAVYERVMSVFEQSVELLGDEIITVKEFGQLLDAGFDEIRIGMVPKSTDYVQVGDITRSRLRNIKALFVVGVNDGIVPPSTSAGGLLTDMDKEYLKSCDLRPSFAPTSREAAYSQRLYLYMLLTKPSLYLALSYSRMSPNGESIRPSYLIRVIRNMFPINEEVLDTSYGVSASRISDVDGTYRYLTGVLGEYLRGETEITPQLENLVEFYAADENYSLRLNNLIEAGLRKIKNPGESGSECGAVSKAVARAIYGKNIYSSVTRLENYAMCAYRYYLQYGLKLREREVYDFAASDLGIVFHSSLERYVSKLRAANLKMTDVDEKTSTKVMSEACEEAIANLSMSAVYSTNRTAYMLRRIKRIMNRTVEVLRYQAQHGSFEPHSVEVDFDSISDLEALNLKLSEDSSIRLTGTIDRIDTCREGDTTYVKIIDYKSGDTNLDIVSVQEGRQLQLVVYLDAAMQMIEKETGTKTIPAGILYYHIDDPVIKDDGHMTLEQIESEIRKNLKLKGYVNSDKHIIELMDKDIVSKSDIIPVGYTVAGEFDRYSKVLSTDEFTNLITGVREKITRMGNEMLGGNIMSARENGDDKKYKGTCNYCAFKTVCHQKDVLNNSEEDFDNEEAGGEN